MNPQIKGLLKQAEDARRKLLTGQITYEEAYEVVKRFTDMANEKAKIIAKKFGRKAYPIDPRGFLR